MKIWNMPHPSLRKSSSHQKREKKMKPMEKIKELRWMSLMHELTLLYENNYIG